MNLFFSPFAALAVSLILTPALIPLLTRLKFGQSIRDIGPSWHNKKSGTPTMGGIAVIGAVSMLLFAWRSLDYPALLALTCTVGFGAVGFIDDFIKVCLKRNLGLLAWQKLALQILVAVFFVFTGLGAGVLSTQIILPFAGILFDLSWLYIPLAILFMLFVVNSVNLTDGIDGLAASVTVAVMLFFGFAAKASAAPLSVFCYTVAAALLGFLLYNKYPARLFMGDTGSLFLGGAVAAVALLQKNPLILVLVGIIYIIEALSVIIQVASFKMTGKRVFKMSPLHHHFEMCGWSEVKIVAVAVAVTVIGGGAALLFG